MVTSNDNIRSRWQHDQDYLTKTVNKVTLCVPMKLTSATSWIDDMKQWPAVTYIDIINYLVLSEGVDGEELRNYKARKHTVIYTVIKLDEYFFINISSLHY